MKLALRILCGAVLLVVMLPVLLVFALLSIPSLLGEGLNALANFAFHGTFKGD